MLALGVDDAFLDALANLGLGQAPGSAAHGTATMNLFPGDAPNTTLLVWAADVVMTGLVRDSIGRKMSKSLGNVIDPLDVIRTVGADALRFALTRQATGQQDIPFGDEEEALRERPPAFALDATSFRWRDREALPTRLADVRASLFHSIGTCSFFEPVVELVELGVL